MVALQVFVVHLDGHLVIITEFKEEVHGHIAAAGDGGLVANHPVLPSGICKEGERRRSGPLPGKETGRMGPICAGLP